MAEFAECKGTPMIGAPGKKNSTTLVLMALSVMLIQKASCHAQTCPASTPTLSGQAWSDQAPKNVYIDPSLPAAVQASIAQAVSAFSSSTGEPITVLPAGTSDPGTATQDAIRILNSPSGSPTSFAHTANAVAFKNGVPTSQQVSATVSFNLTAILAAATNESTAVPFYDPNQANAAQYVYDTTLHELGHAYGLNDASVPTDPATGEPNYALQPAGASIRNGSVNTNDQGPHGTMSSPQPGGIGAKSVQLCDKKQINIANVPPVVPTHSGGSPPKGGGVVPPAGGSPPGGSGGGSQCSSYEEWDDGTSTLNTYYSCS